MKDKSTEVGPATAPPFEAQPFSSVLSDELEHLRQRRTSLGLWTPALSSKSGSPSGLEKDKDECSDPAQRLDEAAGVFAEAHRLRPFGVAFSGGGIRSATFNLGVLQGLAEKGLLPYIDYLSTVSGGGYIGSWFHGLLRSQSGGDPRLAADVLSPEANPIPESADCDPVSFLRKYSNYLAPRLGLFSADFWVIGVIWLRNVLLNQLILAPAVVALFVLVLLLGFVQQASPGELFSVWLPVILGGVATAVAGRILAKNLRVVVRQTFNETVTKDKAQRRAERSPWIPLLLLFAAVMLGCTGIRHDPMAQSIAAVVIVVNFVVLQIGGGFRRCYKGLHKYGRYPALVSTLHLLWMGPLAGGVTVVLLRLCWTWSRGADPWLVIAYAPPLFCLTLLAGVGLLIGLMGADYPDGAREWTALAAAGAAVWCAGWAAMFTIAVFGPWVVSSLLANYGAAGASVLGVWIVTTVGGVLAGRSPASSGVAAGQNSNRGILALAGVAPTVFMIGYLILIASLAHAILRTLVPLASPATVPASSNPFQRLFGPFAQEYFTVLDITRSSAMPVQISWPVAVSFPADVVGVCLGALVVCTALCLVASSRININEFSLHHFYKNRLVRCYLGASNNRVRQPNAWTGFDPSDDFPISKLRLHSPPGSTSAHTPYLGPLAIINAALNLNTGSELAHQERKSASFIFTPHVCGFQPSLSRESRRNLELQPRMEAEGYRSTVGYMFPEGPGVGTAMAISGAAANPNSGYHTSGPMAFLLTVFDARLGWWLGNPRSADDSGRPGPVFALRYLVSELLAKTDAQSRFVNVSDGGHFDNLGLYELVRRRCRYIILGDAEQDGDLTFGSLGGAIRKCRADFGVEIDLDPAPIRLTNGRSTSHCVVGTIIYPEPECGIGAAVCSDGPAPAQPGKARGWILYMKSSLTGDEPSDVLEYQARCSQFPHESTGDQFFSESQFESYRRLGLHIARSAFEDVPLSLTGRDHTDLLGAFQGLARKWFTPLPVTADAASRLADAYSQLMRRLSETAALLQAFPGLLFEDGTVRATATPIDNAAFAFGLELLQLMENVFTEFKFEKAYNRANPRNAGWVRTFRRWAQCRPFYDQVWERAQGDYNPLFRQFMEHLRSEEPHDVPSRP